MATSYQCISFSTIHQGFGKPRLSCFKAAIIMRSNVALLECTVGNLMIRRHPDAVGIDCFSSSRRKTTLIFMEPNIGGTCHPVVIMKVSRAFTLVSLSSLASGKFPSSTNSLFKPFESLFLCEVFGFGFNKKSLRLFWTKLFSTRLEKLFHLQGIAAHVFEKPKQIQTLFHFLEQFTSGSYHFIANELLN